MRARPLPLSILLALTGVASGLAGLVACGSSTPAATPSAEPRGGGAASEEGSATDEAPSGTAGAATKAPVDGADTSERVRFDLAAHFPRAELRQGEAQVIDLGVPGGHKYTLGRWRTRIGADVDDEGVSASAIENVTGFVIVPSDVAAARTLRVRARAPGGDGRVTVYIDGATVGTGTLPSDGSWGTLAVELPAERVTLGEMSIQLRVPRTGSIPGHARVGLLIDWVRLGPAGDEHPDDAPPAPGAVVTRVSDSPALAIPGGWTLGYAMEVPEGARLRGTVRGSGALEVVAHRDGAEPLSLGRVQGTERGALLDLDMSALASSISRIDLRATAGLSVTRPRVITRDRRELLSAQAPAKNVVVYLTDTLRADKLRPYRAESRVRTPAFDTWAQRAAVLLRGHSQENWTKPSVATLLTGLFPWEHQTTGEDSVLPRGVDMMSETLSTRGFYTGAFIANGFCSDRFGFEQGWDTFRNYIREGRRSQARFVAADVLEWLDNRPADEPFMLYVHTIDPHVPYIPPDDILETYDPGPYSGIVNFQRDRELLEGIKVGRIHLGARDRQRLEALYDAEITYHDTHFGAIVQALEQRGLADETVFVFTADHGEEFFDHDSVGHGHSVYEELLNVPLVVRVPGITDGGLRIEDSVGLVDVLPTVFEAIGQTIPQEASGESFLPLLRGEAASAPRYAVSGFMEGWRAINVGRLKLIHRTERRIMLFDLAADPGETHDIASDHPIAVRYARGLLGLGLAQAEHPEHRRRAIAAERATIDAVTRAQLEQLGYGGGSRAGVPIPEDEETPPPE